jgi:hypothetical protein
MKLSPRTAQVNLRVSPELKEAAEAAAEEQQRSLTSLIEVLLMKHLRETGRIPDNKQTKSKR